MQRIKSSLTAKVFLWVACVLALCSFLIYAFVMILIPKQYTTLTNARMEQAVTQLAAELDGTDYASAREIIYNFCIENHTTAMLMTGAETILFGEEHEMAESENTSAVSLALQLSGFTESCVLTVISSASTAGEITDTFLKFLPFVAVLILLISSLSAWLCSRILVKPVLEINNVAKRMAQMDMTWHCETGRPDELGTLANSLNTLSWRLTQAMGELEAANVQLREDIATAQILEKQRRDFFAAASHELKTPVTILKGHLESMALGIGDYKNHAKYLPQTLAAVAHMEQLIQEILTISKMESGIPEASFADEYLAPLLHICITEIMPLAQEKQIGVDAQQISQTVSAHVNRQLFQKVISNILANAVRYSPQGARISLALTADTLTVDNTGVTIAQTDLPFLFTPFYRADKSRNRESGGTGLGLYIVKTVLDLHGFSYRIENTNNAVRFTILFSQNKTK